MILKMEDNEKEELKEMKKTRKKETGDELKALRKRHCETALA